MKKLFLLLTLISLPITLFGMEMEQPDSAPQDDMVTIEIIDENNKIHQFKIERKFAELSGTIKNFIEDAQDLSPDDSTVPLDITTEQ